MASDQREYYLARAAEERDAAARAPTRGIFRFHEEMAAMYDRRAKEAERELDAVE